MARFGRAVAFQSRQFGVLENSPQPTVAEFTATIDPITMTGEGVAPVTGNLSESIGDITLIGAVNLIEVPDVVGQDEASATTELEGEGFVVTTSIAYSSTVATGDVIGQTPGAGELAVEGSTVNITVSLGEAPPEVTGGGAMNFIRRRRGR